MKKQATASPVRIMCEIGVLAAFGFVLDELAGVLWKGLFPNGGSISIAMIAVVIMAYRRGFFSALLTGLIMGLLDLATGPYLIAAGPWQVLLQVMLDYVLAYPLVSVAACFAFSFHKAENKHIRLMWLMIGVLVGGIFKLASHVGSGMLFWADPNNDWHMDPYVFAFLYNLAYVGPSTVLSGLVLAAVYYRAPFLFLAPASSLVEEKANEGTTKEQLISSFKASVIGVAATIVFAVMYIKSFAYVDYGEYGSEIAFDANYMVLLAAAILILGAAIITFVYSLKKKSVGIFLPLSISLVSFSTTIYALAYLIKGYKAKPGADALFSKVGIYWIWIAVSLAITIAFIGEIILSKKTAKKHEK